LVVVLVVGATAFGLAGLGRVGGGPLPSDSGSVSTPGSSATPTLPAVPGFVLDLPIIEVTDAIAVRDAGVDDRELAVLGWFTPAPLISCGVNAAKVFVSPLQLHCPSDELIWLTERPESLIHLSGPSLVTAPSGPAINPFLDGLDRAWQRPPPQIGDAIADSTPVGVVFLGHFDDRRADLCPEAEQAGCRDRFVVDAVAMVEGVPQPRSVVREVRQAGMVQGSSEADIAAIVANEAPQSPILSMVVTDGAEGLVRTEPSLADGQQGLASRPIVWVVRGLESERVVTYIVVDGTDAIYEMTREGDAVQVGGSTGDPVVTPEPWPPAGAVVIALPSRAGAGDPPVRAAVVDESGRLISVSEKGTVDPSDAPIGTSGSQFDAYAEPGKPGRVHLVWQGGMCDSAITVTVAADIRSISFDSGPQPENCDSLGVTRELVLDFSGTVDVPSIELLEAPTDPAGPTGVGYELLCGPIDQAACTERGLRIFQSNLEQSPSRHIVRITFTADECGSFTVDYDDRTSTMTIIDCFPTPSPG
jgi:hypothetical protein